MAIMHLAVIPTRLGDHVPRLRIRAVEPCDFAAKRRVAYDRVNMATGQREPWKTIQPAGPVGVDSIIRILITPDGGSYCHDYVWFLSNLFIVEGLK
jgi:hypothetical protein